MFAQNISRFATYVLVLSSLLVMPQIASAQADGDARTDNLTRVIPYEGTIEVDGAGFTGALGLRFTLFDETDTALWTETYAPGGDSGANAQVYSGTFSVLLGEFVPLTSVVLDAEDLFVGVELSTDDFASSVPLTGRQRIGMAPFAIWASASADFEVADVLSVGNAVDLGSGCVRFDNNDSRLCSTDPAYPDEGVTLRALENPEDEGSLFRVMSSGGAVRFRVEHNGDVEVNNNLLVQDPPVSGTEPGGNIVATGTVSVGSNLDVGGNASVDGSLTVSGGIDGTPNALTVSDEFSLTNRFASTGTVSQVTRLDRLGNSMCYLSRTTLSEPSDTGEGSSSGCTVFEGAGSNSGWWMLRAEARPGVTTNCSARCLTW